MRREVDVARPVVEWLEAQHWDVYQEVQCYRGRADIVATNGFLVWVVECKTSLTLSVMDQARRWPVHFRSVAVPTAYRSRDSRGVAFEIAEKYFKVGVLTVSDTSYNSVTEKVPAPLIRHFHKASKRIVEALVPEQKYMAEAGSKSGDYYTPYKGTMMAVRNYIKKNPGCTLKEIMTALGKMHYASEASARSSIPRALRYIEDWCRIDESKRPFRFYIKGD